MPSRRVFAALALALLVVPTFPLSAHPVPALPATAFFPATIQVVDTQGLNIDGASVEIVNLNNSAIVDQGRTINGTFKSTPLANNDTFNAIVSTSAQTKQQYFTVANGPTVVQFTLLRALPVSQVTLASVAMTPNPSWTNVTGSFTFVDTGQSNVTTLSVSFNSTYPLTVLGSGTLFPLGAILVGANRTLTVKFAVQPLANQGVYSIPYVLFFTDAYGRNFTTQGTFAFNLNRVSTTGASQLVIPSISYLLQQSGAGYTVVAHFVLENAGQSNITASSISFNSTYPLTVLGSGTLFDLGVIPVGGNLTLTVNFAIQPQANEGVYSIPYELSFTDAYGRNFTTAGNFGFTLDRVVGASQLVISSVSYNTQRAENAYTVSARLVITNTGQTNVTSSSIQFNSASASVLGSGPLFYLGEIPVNSNHTLEVTFVVQAKPNEGLVSIPYLLNYTSGGGSASEAGSISVLINGSPEVEIASVGISSTKLTPGESSVLSVYLTNVGDQQALNVRVQLVGMGPVLSSNSSFVGIIQSGTNASTTFGLNLPSGIPTGSHSLTIMVTYQDLTGNLYNVTLPYHFNVFPPGTPAVKVQSILTDPVVLTAGTNGLMTVYLVNAGNQQALNVVAQISGAQDILSTEDFTVGEINPNSTATTILGVNINPAISTGSHLLRIDITYTNPLGQSFNESSFEEVTIYPTQSFLTPVNLAAIGGAVAVVIALILIARRLDIKV